MSQQLTREVILGVDTHLDKHVGVIIDGVNAVAESFFGGLKTRGSIRPERMP